MRAFGFVLRAPILDADLRFPENVKDLAIQAFIPELVVNAPEELHSGHKVTRNLRSGYLRQISQGLIRGVPKNTAA